MFTTDVNISSAPFPCVDFILGIKIFLSLGKPLKERTPNVSILEFVTVSRPSKILA